MSRVNYKLISNEEAVPVFKSDLFKERSDKHFVAISLGYGLYPKSCDRELFFNYLCLRKNVYIDQTGMIGKKYEMSDGTEIDDDDSRSYHIVVAENRGDGQVAFLGCLRLIIKNRDNANPLPVEVFFPELYRDNPLPLGSIEISRFISRAEKGSGHNYKIIMSMMQMSFNVIEHYKVTGLYGVIEEDLEKSLQKFGNGLVKRIASPKFVPEYNDYNIGIKLDVRALSAYLNSNSNAMNSKFDSGKLFF